jgi:hypothetical protein
LFSFLKVWTVSSTFICFSVQNSALAALHEKLDDLKCDLHVAEILHHNSISKPLSFIKDCKSDAAVVQQLMVRVARIVARK